MTLTRPSKISSEGKHAARISMWLLWWAPLSVLIGFLAANRFLAESWPLWQVVPMALILATPFVVGARYGLRAVRSGVGSGWIGFLLHLILAVIALVMPIVEAVA